MIHIILILIVVGVLLWLVSQIQMDTTIRTLIKIIVIVATIFWLIQVFHLEKYLR